MISFELQFYFLRHDVIGVKMQFSAEVGIVWWFGLLALERSDGMGDEVFDFE